MILDSVSLALGQLAHARFRRVVALGVGITLAALAALTWGAGTLAAWAVSGWDIAWLDRLAGAGGILAALVASVFLMVPIAMAVQSFFLEDVARAVEDRHYPALPPALPVPWADALLDSVKALGVLILANLAALVLYFTPAAPFVFYGLNGFLLGREYFQLAAMRRVGPSGAAQLRRRHWAIIWAAGVLMALPLTIPIVNLLVPVLGAATFTHLFHHLTQDSP